MELVSGGPPLGCLLSGFFPFENIKRVEASARMELPVGVFSFVSDALVIDVISMVPRILDIVDLFIVGIINIGGRFVRIISIGSVKMQCYSLYSVLIALGPFGFQIARSGWCVRPVVCCIFKALLCGEKRLTEKSCYIKHVALS